MTAVRAVITDHARTTLGPASTLVVLLSLLSGCSSFVYHDLTEERYRSSGYAIEFHLDEISWLTGASGETAMLKNATRNAEEIKFFESFKPDSNKLYYILAVRADKETATGAAPNVFGGEVVFDSLAVIAGSRIEPMGATSLLQRHWSYSGSNYCGLEPISIPKTEKSVSLKVVFRIKGSGDSSEFERVVFTLPVTQKRFTRTPLNRWP